MPDAPGDRPSRPPRFAEALLHALLPGRDRAPILGDLAEDFGRRAELDGDRAARRWYRRQVIKSLVPAVRRRFRNEKAKRSQRERGEVRTMGRRGFGISWLDVKLGGRMLAKHPVITVASIFALAVGIPVGMAPKHMADAVKAPLPEDPGDRIRSIRYWDLESDRDVAPGYFEYAQWRDELSSFETLGAYRMGQQNVAAGDGLVPVPGAEVTASTFAILGTPPLQGRVLGPEDEREGAPAVVVVGYGVWQTHLGGAPDAVGSTLRLGGVPHTVVGVMPEGFLFPTFAELWLPLTERSTVEPRIGDYALGMFGRLADGVDVEEAQAEVATLGHRLATDFPETHARLDAEVVAFGTASMGMPRGGPFASPYGYPFLALSLALLLVACLNVAMLIFARTATRSRELGIRSALGAGRARIVSQMFVESLLLAIGAVAVGLPTYAWLVDRTVDRYLQSDPRIEPIPYWFDVALTGEAVAWAFLLAIVSAAVVGVIPALEATGGRVQRTIQKAQAGRSGLRFGGVTGVLIVADVALAVTAVGFAIGISDRVRESGTEQGLVGVAADEYLVTRVTLPGGPVPWAPAPASKGFVPRLAALQQALVERLEAEPRVRSVAVAGNLPRTDHSSLLVEVESSGSGDPGVPTGIVGSVNRALVDVDYFEALDQTVIEGRAFEQADLAGDAAPVIVNTSFVDRVLGGRNPIGRRVRFPTRLDDAEAPWREIIGVVPRLGMNSAMPGRDEGVYFPVAPGEIHPLRLAIRVDGEPETLEPRVRAIVAELDADAVLDPAVVMDRLYHPGGYMIRLTTASLGFLVAVLIAMAASGLYAMMSFAVSERTREIGIRAALGASKRAIALGIGRRSLVQVVLGALIGMPLAGWLFQQGTSFVGGGESGAGIAFGVALGIGVAVVALIGCASFMSPIRRALGITPTEALRET
jgi:predicted permease